MKTISGGRVATRPCALLLWMAWMGVAVSLGATPTRMSTLDNSQMLVPDDTDATVYYHLAPNFNNHFYLDVLPSGKVVGWTFLDIEVGTLVLWWNRDYAAKSAFTNLQGGSLGYTLADLNAATGNAHAPLETWIRDPDMKIAAGFALEKFFTEKLKPAICVQYATLNQTRDADASGAASLARYMGGAYYGPMQVSKYRNTQSSLGIALAPSLGWYTENYALDLKAEFITNRLDNQHVEEVHDGTPANTGTLTQSLKDKGAPSMAYKSKLRVPLGDGALVLRGSSWRMDMSTEHRQLGRFQGAGFNAAELAGFDQVDASETLIDAGWESMAGWTYSFNQSRALLVIGLGAGKSAISREDLLYAPRGTGPVARYDDLVRSSRRQEETTTFSAPLLIGVEGEVAKFAALRGFASKELVSRRTSSIVTTSYDSQGLETGTSASSGESDLDQGVKLGAGLGLRSGSLSWDLALNASFLSSGAGLANPATQSSLAWGW